MTLKVSFGGEKIEHEKHGDHNYEQCWDTRWIISLFLKKQTLFLVKSRDSKLGYHSKNK